MDFLVRKLIEIKTELQKLHRTGRQLVVLSHSALSDIAHSLDNLKSSIDENRKSDEKAREAEPRFTIANLRTDIPISVETKAHHGKIEQAWRVIKGALEAAAFVAIIFYTVFAYNQWQALLQSNDVAMSSFRRTRIDANEQVKGLQKQMTLARQQLEQAERPWAEIAYGRLYRDPGEPLAWDLSLINTGKTAARKITVRVFIEHVPRNRPPRLHSSKAPPYTLTSGILFPGAKMDIFPTRKRNPLKPGMEFEDDKVTGPESTELDGGEAYLAVYGRVDYYDIFNIPHWTTFCNWKGFRRGLFVAEKCVAYNDVDNNQR